jgi:hypothetical protein
MTNVGPVWKYTAEGGGSQLGTAAALGNLDRSTHVSANCAWLECTGA